MTQYTPSIQDRLAAAWVRAKKSTIDPNTGTSDMGLMEERLQAYREIADLEGELERSKITEARENEPIPIRKPLVASTKATKQKAKRKIIGVEITRIDAPFTILPDEIINLQRERQFSMAAGAAYLPILSLTFGYRDTGNIISQEGLARKASISVSALARALKELEEKKVITREIRRDSKGYRRSSIVKINWPIEPWEGKSLNVKSAETDSAETDDVFTD